MNMIAGARRGAPLLLICCGAMAGACCRAGYPWFSAETLYAVTVTSFSAVALPVIDRRGRLTSWVIAAVSALVIFALTTGAGTALRLTGSAVTGAACLFFPGPARSIMAAAMVSIAVAASLSRPTSPILLVEREGERPNVPAIIHIVLDEYGAPWARMRDAGGTGDDRTGQFWLKHGFVLMDQSYGLEDETFRSIARILAGNAPPRASVEVDRDRGLWTISSAPVWRRIEARRLLDISTFFELGPVLRSDRRVARAERRDPRLPWPAVSASGLGVRDRLAILAARILATDGIGRAIEVALAALPTPIRSNDGIERIAAEIDHLNVIARTHVLADRLAIADFARRLGREGRRGTYYYLHVLLPHPPFALDPLCVARPTRDWLGRAPELATHWSPSRAQRYRLYDDQVACADRAISGVLAAIDRNPALRDAVVIVQGDHGSRINVDRGNLDRWIEAGGTRGTFERDWRAGLLAVRLRGESPRRAVGPFSLHRALVDMADTDFRRLPPREASAQGDPIFGR